MAATPCSTGAAPVGVSRNACSTGRTSTSARKPAVVTGASTCSVSPRALVQPSVASAVPSGLCCPRDRGAGGVGMLVGQGEGDGAAAAPSRGAAAGVVRAAKGSSMAAAEARAVAELSPARAALGVPPTRTSPSKRAWASDSRRDRVPLAPAAPAAQARATTSTSSTIRRMRPALLPHASRRHHENQSSVFRPSAQSVGGGFWDPVLAWRRLGAYTGGGVAGGLVHHYVYGPVRYRDGRHRARGARSGTRALHR